MFEFLKTVGGNVATFDDGIGDSNIDEYDQVVDYNITSAPNDFNIRTIFDFLDSGVFVIPGFQRNYVWDIKRASKLIESLVIGLPIPQIFLYETEKNKFLVIDGQQRLMSIYYFMKKRFPKKERRGELRRILSEGGQITPAIFDDNEYFSDFRLRLPENLPQYPNRFNGQTYDMLGDYRMTFDLRTVRNIIVKQNDGDETMGAVFEIFNRLNSGGVNLTPQEIRASLFHSKFYAMLYSLNAHQDWRRLLGDVEPDLHLKDIEVILRGFAMLEDGDDYSPSMVKFLNKYSKQAQKFDQGNVDYRKDLFVSFVRACQQVTPENFMGKNKQFNISLYESVFYAICREPFDNRSMVTQSVDPNFIERLKNDVKFQIVTQSQTTKASNVKLRLKAALDILGENYQ